MRILPMGDSLPEGLEVICKNRFGVSCVGRVSEVGAQEGRIRTNTNTMYNTFIVLFYPFR